MPQSAVVGCGALWASGDPSVVGPRSIPFFQKVVVDIWDA